MKMKQAYLSLTILLFSSSVFAQQPVVDGAVTPEEAVQLLLGTGVEAFNITFSGDLDQVGSFDCDNCGVGIGNGVILASGSVSVATGPNDSPSFTEGGGNFGANDIDLDALSPFGTNDAAILEFDFIPQGDSIRFNYVFGSEEYNEYVCGTVNDAFGFFLSGPGIVGPFSSPPGFPDGSVNLALVPGTDIPVTINTVNNGQVGSNGFLQNCVDVSPDWNLNTAFYIDNENNNDPNTTQFDGHTVVLEAQAQVVCGETYHIKIVIADGGDTAFDSGVFLEADSFTSNQVLIDGTASIDTPVFLGDSILLEGCNVATFVLTRPNSSEEQTFTVNISGTATNGVDYLPALETEYTFPEGVNTIELPPFSAVLDGETEGTESIILSYVFINDCGDEITIESTLYIQDYFEPEIIAEDVISPCPNFEVQLISQGSGFGPFTYLWDTEQTNNNIFVSPEITTSYTVEVTDVCGGSATADVEVTVLQDPEPVVLMDMPDIEIECPGDPTQITSEVISGTPNYSYLWSTNAQTQNTQVTPTETTTYVIEVTDACFQVAVDSITVTVPTAEPIELNVSINQFPTCPGDEIILSSQVSGGFGGYQYDWTPGVGNGPDYSANPEQTTTYILSVTDVCNQNETTEFEVVVPVGDPPLTASAEALNIPGCPGDEVTLSGTASGGFGTDLILTWTLGDGITVEETEITVNPTEPTTYVFSAVDECGITQNIDVFVDVPVNPIGIETVGAEAACVGFEVEISAFAEGGFGTLSYSWPNGDDTQTTTVAPDNINGTTFTVSVTDECGVVETADAEVTVTQHDPITISTDAGEAYCLGDDVLAEADADGGLPPYSYVWSNGEEGSDVIVNPSIPGGESFEVTVTDACGTQATEDVFAEVGSFDPIEIGILADSCAGSFGYLFSVTGGADPISFSDIYSEPIGVIVDPLDSTFTNPIVPGIYDIIVVDACGNTGVYTLATYLCEIVIPNVITPNNDDINDFFIIENLYLFKDSKLKIWNRWGGIVYESDDYGFETKPFDGKDVSDGTYFYELLRSDGKEFSGSLTVTR